MAVRIVITAMLIMLHGATLRPMSRPSPLMAFVAARMSAKALKVITPRPTPTAAECLAGVIWNEAGGEPESVWRWVAGVVLSRARLHTYPNTICGVVHDPNQFEYQPIPPSTSRWREIRSLAQLWVRDSTTLPQGWTHFHDLSIPAPTWTLTMPCRHLEGRMMFYKVATEGQCD